MIFTLGVIFLEAHLHSANLLQKIAAPYSNFFNILNPTYKESTLKTKVSDPIYYPHKTKLYKNTPNKQARSQIMKFHFTSYPLFLLGTIFASLSSGTPDGTMSLPMREISPNKKQGHRSLADPPYWGTIFVDENIITDSHPNALQRIDMYDEKKCGKWLFRHLFFVDERFHISFVLTVFKSKCMIANQIPGPIIMPTFSTQSLPMES